MKSRALLQTAVAALLVLAVLASPFSVSGQGSVTTRTVQYYTSRVLELSAASSGTCRHIEAPMGAVAAGDVIAGSISSDGGVAGFAIMNTDECARLQSDPASVCGALDRNSRYYKEGRAFQFQWTSSALTAYYLVVLNRNSVPITVTLSAYLVTTSPGQYLTTTSNTYSYTSTTYPPVTQTRTTSTASTTPFMIGPLSIPFDSLSLAVVVVLGVIVLAVLGAWRIRSSAKRRPSEQVTIPLEQQQIPRVTQEEVGRQFCLNCGTPLPLGSKFCTKCGVPQE